MLIKDLNGSWEMKRIDEAGWTPAQVPGSVYADLLNAGRMADPFYRDNEYEALELSNFDYEYRRMFVADRAALGHDRVTLLCEGLDTLCRVFLNGAQVLSANNMHRTYEVDVKDMLREGENEIRAVFSSPVEYVRQRQKERPLINSSDAIEGISHLRKAHCMFGWDWGPKLPDMGIWRNISLRAYDRGRMDGVYVTQNHEPGRVTLHIQAWVEAWGLVNPRLRAEATAPGGGTVSGKFGACADENSGELVIEAPELWWPNTMGGQPLYALRVTLQDDAGQVDACSLRIGLRSMTVRREKDEWGESFAFTVNGVPVFAKGADYIPEDNILARCSRLRTEKLIRSCVKANFNCIRVWGGGFYPGDDFYDLCDEYGLLVWQDLMYACGVYELNDGFRENITQETEDNMKRLRNHASLALWCGNNEQEWAWVSWDWDQPQNLRLKADYLRQFEILLPEIAKKTDPNTFYWLASPSSGGCFDRPNDESAGDMHYWEVWHGRLPFTAYRTIYPRFMSEFGLQSFPCLKTVKSFTLPEDRNIFSYVMESHQKNGTGNEKILYYIGENFRMPKDFGSLLYVSQLIQAEGLRNGVEHWRRNRGRCMGAVYWQLNDCWPVASWSSIDYFGRWKALHYAARRFFAPVLASACEEGLSVSLHVTNDSLSDVTGKMTWRLVGANGETLECGELPVVVASMSDRECARLDFTQYLDTNEKQRSSYLEFSFETEDGERSGGTTLFVKPKHFSFRNPRLQTEVEELEDRFVIAVTAQSYARHVELDLQCDDAIFSDNCFDLPHGGTRQVEALKSDLSRSLTAAEFEDQLTARSLFDTYE